MKNLFVFLLVIIALMFAFAARALQTIQLVYPTTVTTASTNGNPVTYSTYQLIPPQLIFTHGSITNTAGTNAIGSIISITVAPTNLVSLYPLSTNAGSDTYTSQSLPPLTVTVAVTGSITNTGGSVTNCQLQIQQ